MEMQRMKYPWLVCMGLLLVVAIGCGGGGDSSPSDGGNHFQAIDVGPQGGDFDLPNGVSVSIPPGAVADATTFEFRIVTDTECNLPSTYFRRYDKHFLAGIEARPYGYVFGQPIRLRIPAADLPSTTSLPYPLVLDTTTGELQPIGGFNSDPVDPATWAKAVSGQDLAPPLHDVVINDDGHIDLPDLSALPDHQNALVLLALEKIRKESDCVDTPCRCGRIRVESDDFDSSGSAGDDCYSVYADGFVQYLDCDYQPIEPWSLHESNLDLTITPSNATIKVEDVAQFSISMTDEQAQPVTDFLILAPNIENTSVISLGNIGADSISFEGLDPGISAVEVMTESGGCQYKGWLSVEVEASKIVVSDRTITIPEGEARSVGVKLSDPPGVTQPVLVTALVGGDDSISLTSSSNISFDLSNWDTYQYLLIAAAEDEDTDNGSATVTLLATPDSYIGENVAVTEIDTDSPNFRTNTDLVTVPEGGSASFLLRLNGDPVTPVQADVGVVSGDSDISIIAGASLVFDTSNWNTGQRITLFAAHDEDTDNGSAQIRISTTTPGVGDRLITAVEKEKELEVDQATVAIEGSAINAYGDWSQWWYGTVTITITADPANPCWGWAEGAGQLVYYDDYAYEGCYFRETGVIDVSMDGWHDCSTPPWYTLNAWLTKNTTKEYICPDSYYSEANVGPWQTISGHMGPTNDDTHIYQDARDYHRIELIDRPE